jgi:ornithine cyclodeaminase/alanine dehydrogenase-like protein (mu-crystallin family)
MTLLINNDDVSRLLTASDTIDALEHSYLQLANKEAVCRPRIDIQIPTADPAKIYRWGSMEGGSVSGYFAIRIKSDIVYESNYAGVVTKEKYCGEPGKFCGLIILIDTSNGLPVAILNDGVLQHMRVGADGAIGVKYMSRPDSHVVGILGSGGMARTHVEAFLAVRDIQRVQVFSPTPENREKFAEEIRNKYGIEAVAYDRPEDIYKGADIVAGLTDSSRPVLNGDLIEPGTHVLNVGGGGLPDAATLARIDLFLRFGDAPAPWGLPEFGLGDEHLTYGVEPSSDPNFTPKRKRARGHDRPAGKTVSFVDVYNKRAGRASNDDVTYSERGNIQGAQFWAVASRVYELAKNDKIERSIPTEWLLQDIRN